MAFTWYVHVMDRGRTGMEYMGRTGRVFLLMLLRATLALQDGVSTCVFIVVFLMC